MPSITAAANGCSWRNSVTQLDGTLLQEIEHSRPRCFGGFGAVSNGRESLLQPLRQAPRIESMASVGICDRAQPIRRHTFHHSVAHSRRRDLIDRTQQHQCSDASRPRNRATAVRIIHHRLREYRCSGRHGLQCCEHSAATIRPTNDSYPTRVNVGLTSDPRRGFEYVLTDLGMRKMPIAVPQVPPAEVVYQYHEISRRLQFGCAFVVQIDTVVCDKAGTSGDK